MSELGVRRSIEELTLLQDRLGLRDRHVVDLDARGFTIAHTDGERSGSVPLHRCPLHTWLMEHGRGLKTGLFVVEQRLSDPTSESHRGDASPYLFTPVSQLA